MKSDNIYMRRALELASLAVAYTGTNPMVGAVVVYQGRIIGEGYHHRYGEPHAEVMAIRSVKDEDKEYIRESTLYVTLEPCSHHGKTPPCADLILSVGIPRVVVAQLDPYPEVSGRGIARLRESGVQVDLYCLESEARSLNKAFNKRYEYERPYVLLKWAESADRYIDAKRALGEGLPIIFSSAYRQRLVHRSRRDYQSILIGAHTAMQDNPSLTNRYWGEKQPIRIVLDFRLSLPRNLNVFIDNKASTWCIYDADLCTSVPEDTVQVKYCGLHFHQGRVAEGILSFLVSQGIQSVFVEGGGKTLQMFIDEGLYDEVCSERSPLRLGSGVPAPCFNHRKL